MKRHKQRLCNLPYRQPALFFVICNSLGKHMEKIMKCNVGSVDRILRIVAGLVLIGLTLSGMIGVWGWIGLAPLLTGIFRFCPGYALFGMSTGCSSGKCTTEK